MEKYTEEQLELQQLANECFDEANKLLDDGQLKLAADMADRARNLFSDINDQYALARTLNILAIICSEMGNETLGLDYMLDALSIASDENYYNLSSRYYNNIGSKYLEAKSYDQALIYFNSSMEMFHKGIEAGTIDANKEHDIQLILNLNLTCAYCELGDLEKTKLYFEKAKQESLHPDNAELLVTFQSFEGLILWKLGEYEKAKNLLPSIIESVKHTDYIMDYMDVMSDLLSLLKEMRDDDKWESVLKLMDEHVTDELGIGNRLKVQRYWIDFYETTKQDLKYKEACVSYYKLARKIEILDNVRRGDNISLKIDMRRTLKQKQIADSIVYLDPLTGIGNRNRMLEDSRKYIEEALADHHPIMIGLIDIDYFKECNDTYGHVKGDECLREVATIIETAVGDYGNVYRYGGDEFLLLLPNAKEEDASVIGKKIKSQLEMAQIANERSSISPYVTVSQGYTSAFPEEGDTIDQLINLADRVLYTVKRYGRNNYKYMPINNL